MTPPQQWMPTASISAIKERARLLKNIRDFFDCRNIIEVETPILSHFGGTEPNLIPIKSEFTQLGMVTKGFLQTSPEFAMKRLLAAGIGDCYQIVKAFRNEESGRHHNPEFSLLEWYRVGINEMQLLQQVDELLQQVLGSEQAEYCQYQQLFIDHLQCDPLQTSIQQLKSIAVSRIENPPQLESVDEYLELLFCFCIEPKIGLDRPCFVTHYPASQASLARISEINPKLSCRFEIFYKGLELGNGFYELTDAKEQQIRFEKENKRRQHLGLDIIAIDNRFIAALENGLPESSGIAIGIDRMLMILLSAQHIDEVISFPIDRA